MFNLREEYEGYLLALGRGGWAKATGGYHNGGNKESASSREAPFLRSCR